GNGDGFYVVDTNDGGDKANSYVSEQQTDVVTLLPNGGALHHLQISVTYDRKGLVFGNGIDDYFDMQRTYLPGDATILGYSGFNSAIFGSVFNVDCNLPGASSLVNDCYGDQGIHEFSNPTTTSDVPGRTMVMGALTVNCGPSQLEGDSESETDITDCANDPTENTQYIYIEWYTPNAFTMNSAGHGTYSELVQEEPGSGDFLLGVGDYLTVYVDTSQLHNPDLQVDTTPVSDSTTFQQLYANLKPVSGFNGVRLDSDMTVSANF
ncbi:MAG: hypothetical protein ACLQUY_02545, partial [Ktedonobacterales bacterium]